MPPSAAAARAAGKRSLLRPYVLAFGFPLAHVALALAFKAVHGLAMVHAVASFIGAVVFTLTTRRIQRVAIPLAYLAGCEVLWRMSKAGVFWEYGKYSMIAVMLIAILRLHARRNLLLPLLYFALLLPSVVLTFTALGPVQARDSLSFVMSGPLAIACAVALFSSIRLTASELRMAFVALVGAVAAVSTLVFVKFESVSSIQFVNGSNSMASGGFGPNQVSAILGLAMMLLVLLAMDHHLPKWLRLLLLGPATLLAFQTTLTFARGGIMIALAGCFGAMFVLLRSNPRARAGVLTIAVLSYFIGTRVVEPKLDEIAGAKLGMRYTNLQTSGRDQVVESELDLFSSHPAAGVGPGVGAGIRMENGDIGPSHTEYTRMLAEHGLLGALSLICMMLFIIRAVLAAKDPDSRALALAMVVWATLFLLVYATRIAAPALMFGLAQAVPRSTSTPRKATAMDAFRAR